MDKKTKKVQIYSTPSCVYCNMAKEYFKKNNISFEEYNVATDIAKRHEMVEKSGQMGVPVIIIDQTLIVGFEESKISSLLGVK